MTGLIPQGLGALLRNDLHGVGNAFRHKDNRGELLGTAIFFGGMAMAGLAAAGKLIHSETLVDALREDHGPLLEAVWLTLLVTPLFLAVPVGGALIGTSLFTEPGLPLLVSSPVSRVALIVRAVLRGAATCAAFHLSLGLPMVIGLTIELGWSWFSLVTYTGLVSVLAPAAISVLAISRVVRERFVVSRRLRACFQASAAIVIMALTAGALLGLVSSDEQEAWVIEQLQAIGELPWLLSALVGLAGAPAGCPWSVSDLFAPLILLAATVPGLLLVTPLYDRAVENSTLGRNPVVRIRGRRWPQSLTFSIAYKDALLIVQEKSGLIAYLFFACLQLMLLKSGLYSGIREHSPLPAHWQEAFGLIMCWLILLMMLAPIHALGLVETEKKQLPILATAPITPAQLLRGKLCLLAAPFVWTWLVIVLGAPWIVDASIGGVAGFIALGLPILIVIASAAGIVSTHPMLFEIEGPLANSVRAIAPLAIIMATGIGLIVGSMTTRKELERAYRLGEAIDPVATHALIIGVAWFGAMLAAACAQIIGSRNLRRLLEPRR